MNKAELAALIKSVQTNCHITDARHGGEYTLCVYLLKMREYYRWHQQQPLSARLPKDDVGSWLSDHEALLESLEDAEFQPIQIGPSAFDPFDEAAINAILVPQGLVYSAGLGQRNVAHFFLAELESRQQFDGFRITVSDRELARDLSAPPGLSRDGEIYIRRESLRRALWERIDVWNWSKPQNAMAHAVASYRPDDDLEDALDRMTADHIAVVTEHEKGEVAAGRQLGPDWQAMISATSGTHAELVARAVRDHLADCTHTLPTLLDEAQRPALHLYMGGLSNMRKHLFPRLQNGYERNQLADIDDWLSDAADHWLTIARQMLDEYRQNGRIGVLSYCADHARFSY